MLKNVVALVLPGVAPFELGVTCELFGVDRKDTGGPSFDFTLCTPEPGSVRTNLGFTIDIQAGLDVTQNADLVVIPSFPRGAELTPAIVEVLRSVHARGARLLSVCSGAFALAEAGLLDGRRCTTHWMYTQELAQRYPSAEVDPAVLYVDDDRITTSAGSAAGIDAGLYLIRCELGAAMAAAVARRMVVPPQRDGGQAQYIDRPILPVQADSLSELLDWMTANLSLDQSVETLAAKAHMSPRTFARRFRAETGTTPASWLTKQRLHLARELLEKSNLSVESIANKVGFGTAAVLRHHFTRTVGTTPHAYRRTFACPEDMLREAEESLREELTLAN